MSGYECAVCKDTTVCPKCGGERRDATEQPCPECEGFGWCPVCVGTDRVARLRWVRERRDEQEAQAIFDALPKTSGQRKFTAIFVPKRRSDEDAEE